jgi:hypothetical protein
MNPPKMFGAGMAPLKMHRSKMLITNNMECEFFYSGIYNLLEL